MSCMALRQERRHRIANAPPHSSPAKGARHCVQVFLAQWLPSKALEEVLATTKFFQQSSLAAATAAQGSQASQAQADLTPQLWLQCRIQVRCFSGLLKCDTRVAQLPPSFACRDLDAVACMHGSASLCTLLQARTAAAAAL